jgi:hypothetical protein
MVHRLRQWSQLDELHQTSAQNCIFMVATVEFVSAARMGETLIHLRADGCRHHLRGLFSSIAHLMKTSHQYSKQ